jgi:hypothetical protein
MSYGSYLGNGHDFRNDFAHTQTIPFSLGAEIDAGIMNEPVFVIGVAEACFQRTTQQFGRPPVQYVKRTCTKLKDTLDAKEASGPGYYVLKIFNGKKL